MNTINIQGNFYRQEKIRTKKESLIIIPKKKKEIKNAQIKLSFSYFIFPNALLLSTTKLFLEQWPNYFEKYPIFRIFYDTLPENSSRILISFNTPDSLSREEGDNILKIALQIMEKILNNSIDSDQNNSTIQNINNELDKQEILLSRLIKDDQNLNLQNKYMQDANLVNNEYEAQLASINMITSTRKMITDDEHLLRNSLEEQIITLNEQLNEKNSETTLIKNEKDNLIYKLSQKTEKLETLKKQLINQKNRNNTLKDKYNDTQNKLIEKTEINKTITSSIKKLQNIINETNKELLKEVKLKNDATELSNNLQARIDEISNERQKQLTLKENLIRTSNELQQSLDKSNNDLQKEKEFHKNKDTVINNLQNSLDEANIKLQEQTKIIAETTKLADSLQLQFYEVSDELKKQITLTENLISTSNNLQQSLDKSNNDLQKEKESHKNKDTVINNLQNSLDEANIKLQEQTKIIAETTKLADSLQLQFYEVSDELKKQITLNENLTSTSDNFQNSLDKLKKELQLEKELNKKNNHKINDLQNTLKKSSNNLLEETIKIPDDSHSKSEQNAFKTPISEKKLLTTLNEISTDWERIYKISETNYQQIQTQATNKKKINYGNSKKSSDQLSSSSLNNFNKKNKSKEDSLTNNENVILELFNHYNSSKSNKTMSISLEEYNYYMDTLPFLPSTWQTYFMNSSNPKNNKFYRTFNPFIDELTVLLEEISRNASPKLLNRKKITIDSDDLQLLEAYDSLLTYISKI